MTAKDKSVIKVVILTADQFEDMELFFPGFAYWRQESRLISRCQKKVLSTENMAMV